MSAVRKNPVVFAGLLQGVLFAALVGLKAFGTFTPTPDQYQAILGGWAALQAVLLFVIYGYSNPTGDGFSLANTVTPAPDVTAPVDPTAWQSPPPPGKEAI